ncbi:SDR family NAD(P)-dependent oxidoreductase [Pseudotabrizicola algicola]|uniref:SDR family NAD(P)-dependent oxidoreductase n=1 Tax=Pseudotabrizicola algicola TaxID=2709381 RepID=A0A6B3RPA0_9RHOB|nr:SDR family NAD(P)-dependent oxidoreductase [Pseudotabrizicola algicola]NEX47033.1 SDR family NAD(P)-dependent oxidoreductase [Pseudotabrizicola algicola]
MRALVVGASGGIGQALAARLEAQGAQVTRLSRRADGLDLTDEASLLRVLGGLEGSFERIVVATGALELNGVAPEKALRSLDPAAMAAQFALNATGPALVLKHAVRLLPRDRPSVFAALSARVGSIGDNRLGGWHSYRAAKAALNQFIHTGAIEVARSHRQAVVVCLHPGTVDTPLTRAYAGGHPVVSPDQAAGNLLAVMEVLRPEQTGGFFDWQGKEIPW